MSRSNRPGGARRARRPADRTPGGPYRVRFQKLRTAGGRGRAVRTGLIIAANLFVNGAVTLDEGMRLINVFSLSLASLVARDPVPVVPDPSLRAAFLTTIVPGKEPLEMVLTTVAAARRIRYAGLLDVWLLDQGDSEEVRAMCRAEGVRYFSRKDIEQYNQAHGAFKTKTKARQLQLVARRPRPPLRRAHVGGP